MAAFQRIYNPDAEIGHTFKVVKEKSGKAIYVFLG